MKAKFTGGKWEVFGDWGIKSVNSDFIHATFEYAEGNTAEGFANAHLIASAPDMYAMLEDMYETLCLIGDDGQETEEIKNLLAKARGEK